MNYKNKVLYLHPTAVYQEDFMFQDDSDGNGVYIKIWNEVKLGAKPTLAAIDAAVDQATADATALGKEAQEEIQRNTFKKLLFLVNWEQENRLRVLEGSSTITKSAYKTALENKYKTL